MSTSKLFLAAYLVACVLSSLMPSAAQALLSGWMVNGSLLNGSKALASTAQVTQGLTIRAGTSVEFYCTGATLGTSAMEIKSPNSGAATSLTFSGCGSNFGCPLSSPTVLTQPLVVQEATLDGSLGVKAILAPKTKTVFMVFEFQQSIECMIGPFGVTGHVTLLAPAGQHEKTAQEFRLLSQGELKIASSPALASATAQFRLASGESWSFL